MSGHGHVWPNPDGMMARCGGPGLCDSCSKEWFQRYGVLHPDKGVAVPGPAESPAPQVDVDPRTLGRRQSALVAALDFNRVVGGVAPRFENVEQLIDAAQKIDAFLQGLVSRPAVKEQP